MQVPELIEESKKSRGLKVCLCGKGEKREEGDKDGEVSGDELVTLSSPLCRASLSPPCWQFEALYPEGMCPGWSVVVKGETSSSTSM